VSGWLLKGNKLMNFCNLELKLSLFVGSKLWYFYLSISCHHSMVHPQVTGGASGCQILNEGFDCVE
jgi:hypothetical protein